MLTQTIQQQTDWLSWKPKRGEIYLVNLGNEGVGSEQKGLRPFVILSNNIGNSMGNIVVGLPISSRNKGLPKIHVPVGHESGIKQDSYLLTEHIRSISKGRFFTRGNPVMVGQLTEKKLKETEEAIKFELGFIS